MMDDDSNIKQIWIGQTRTSRKNWDFYTNVINIAAKERVITSKQYTFVDSALLVAFSRAWLEEIGADAGFCLPLPLSLGFSSSESVSTSASVSASASASALMLVGFGVGGLILTHPCNGKLEATVEASSDPSSDELSLKQFWSSIPGRRSSGPWL